MEIHLTSFFFCYLVSFLYLLIALYATIVSGFHLLQAWFDTLPPWTCNCICWLKAFISLTGVILYAVITINKFTHVCIWKSVRQMDDNLLARFVIIWSCFISLLAVLMASLGPGFTPSCVVINLSKWSEAEGRAELRILSLMPGFCPI